MYIFKQHLYLTFVSQTGHSCLRGWRGKWCPAWVLVWAFKN